MIGQILSRAVALSHSRIYLTQAGLLIVEFRQMEHSGERKYK